MSVLRGTEVAVCERPRTAAIREAITRHTTVNGADADDLAAFVQAISYPRQRRRPIR